MPDNNKYRDFYSNESKVYEKTRYNSSYGQLFRNLHYRVINDICNLNYSKGMKVLEVACGTGHISRLLNRLGIDTTACDLTPEMMQQASSSLDASLSKSNFVQTNAFTLPFRDDCFDLLISTRFLHLFPERQQNQLIREFYRVLKPGGTIVVDFDNFVSRWLYAIPHLLYNITRYKRLAPDSNYNTRSQVLSMFKLNGFIDSKTFGVGGWHLFFVKLLSYNLAFRLGLYHRFPPLSAIAEQFVITGKKQ